MLSKIEMLCDFYDSIDCSTLKIETAQCSLDYLHRLTEIGKLDYMESHSTYCKYRLSNLSHKAYLELLEQHLKQELNVCVYFGEKSNDLFAFNLDMLSSQGNDLKIFSLYLLQYLLELGICPLILKSGHGYHFWCKLAGQVENTQLRQFKSLILNHVLPLAKQKGVNINNLCCTFYPRQNPKDISIRLFGSRHITTGFFSHVVKSVNMQDVVMDENESWSYFEQYEKSNCIPLEAFYRILNFNKGLAG